MIDRSSGEQRDICDYCGLSMPTGCGRYFWASRREDGDDDTIDFCDGCADALPKCFGDCEDAYQEFQGVL